MQTQTVYAALRRALWLALAIAPAACGAVVSPSDGGVTDARADGGTCFDPSTGRTLSIGESNGQRCPCVCTDSGLACASCPPPPTCLLPDGRTLREGETTFDGCNSCICQADGNLACSDRACVDAGGPDVTIPDGGACAPVVRFTIPSCEALVTYPCGVPGGPVRSGDPRCAALCAPAGNIGIQPGYCIPSTTPNAVQCGVCGVGRFTDGLDPSDVAHMDASTFAGWLARSAYVEGVAAAAFDRLADELAQVDAPRALVDEARESAAHERGHAEIMERFALRNGGLLTPLRDDVNLARRSLEDIALENAAEGCVRETLGAVVMAWQARHAADPALREGLARIADEESRHAAWSWNLDAWARTVLAPSIVAKMDAARRDAIASLAREMTASDPPAALVSHAGMPPASAVRAMIAELSATVWQA